MITAQAGLPKTQAATRKAGGIVEVALLAYPAVLQTMSDTLMHVCDAAIVGRLGVTELAAVGFGGVWMWTLLVIFVGTGNGAQTFVAQSFGAGQLRECGRWAWQALYILVPLSMLWAVVLALAFPLLMTWLGPSEDLRGLAVEWAVARLPGAPALVAGVVLTAFFRGLGNARTPMLAAIVANGANILLAVVFVYGLGGLPAWGVAGAGRALAIANCIYAGILLVAMLRARNRRTYDTAPCKPSWTAIRRMARTSFPVGGQWFLDMVSFALFSTIIARMGNIQMAASQAMIQLLSLSFMQAYGISIASAALVGRYVGARDLAAAQRTHHSALQLGLLLAAIVALLFVLVPDTLLHLFTSDAEVLRLGRPLLALGALFQLVDAMGIIAGGSLRGAGDTRFPFLVQAVLAWMLRLPVVYTAAVVLEGGVTGAWLGELGYVAVLGTIWLTRFRNGAWRTIRI
jgi:putative MATE family efflux protein